MKLREPIATVVSAVANAVGLAIEIERLAVAALRWQFRTSDQKEVKSSSMPDDGRYPTTGAMMMTRSPGALALRGNRRIDCVD